MWFNSRWNNVLMQRRPQPTVILDIIGAEDRWELLPSLSDGFIVNQSHCGIGHFKRHTAMTDTDLDGNYSACFIDTLVYFVVLFGSFSEKNPTFIGNIGGITLLISLCGHLLNTGSPIVNTTDAEMSDSWQDGIEESRVSTEDVNVEDEYRDPSKEYSEGKCDLQFQQFPQLISSSSVLTFCLYKGIRDMEALGLADIGALGSWSVSSHKQGSGIKELREDTYETYWQSDGQQPHHLDIHFSKRVNVTRLSIFTDYTQDESYTPSKILVLSGSGFHDLIEVATMNLNQPIGWKHVIFNDANTTDDDDGSIAKRANDGLKTFLIRLLIVANHQHGKDTHLRSVKIYSPMVGFNMSSTVLGGFTSRKLLSESYPIKNGVWSGEINVLKDVRSVRSSRDNLLEFHLAQLVDNDSFTWKNVSKLLEVVGFQHNGLRGNHVVSGACCGVGSFTNQQRSDPVWVSEGKQPVPGEQPNTGISTTAQFVKTLESSEDVVIVNTRLVRLVQFGGKHVQKQLGVRVRVDVSVDNFVKVLSQLRGVDQVTVVAHGDTVRRVHIERLGLRTGTGPGSWVSQMGNTNVPNQVG
ncbi:hypothetical protein WICPIJ_001149 [Wickerhamomyces pijperi]|uniref:DOC domain-containing protein n=1 Tax=Wickerhamomyces pijperi TaxID=599730 RepID=A0A9P8TQW1_WICPI|nr:hypothetical protein WICPIJ_001149 [Wickerhamomyces pijperi]